MEEVRKVWRVENEEGRGMYQDTAAFDVFDRHRSKAMMKRTPGPEDDARLSEIGFNRYRADAQGLRYAFDSPRQMLKWFGSKRIIRGLRKAGQRVAVYVVPANDCDRRLGSGRVQSEAGEANRDNANPGGRMTEDLEPVETIPAYAVIIRAIHERGPAQEEALAELRRRGLWLSAEQQQQAGRPRNG